jgi:hypothetical protein
MTDKLHPGKEDAVSQAARALAARRRITEGTCEVCGKAFTGTRKRRYCSHNCAQKAYMQNKKQRNEGSQP